MQTIDSIMEEMQGRVINNDDISPASWVESALRINSLVDEVDFQIAKYEAQLINIEAEMIKKDIPASKARILARNEIEYETFLRLKAKRNKISEYIMLAKKRSAIQEL